MSNETQFRHFSGVFGVFDGTQPVETGEAGLADRSFSVPNGQALSYQTASGTKGFTAAAVLSLAAQGKISLDDSVKSILGRDPEKYGQLQWISEAVTVRSLLAHTSGIPDYFDEDHVEDFDDALGGEANYHYERPEQFFPLAEAAWKKQEEPYASAGRFKYSNGGFVVLAAVVEAVSGGSFGAYVNGHIFRPFGMDHSGFFRFDEQAPEGILRASSYQENGRSNIYAVPVIGGGDGGAYTNPSDMARFWNGLDPDLISDSSMADLIRTAWTPLQEGDDGLYGLGFWISSKDPRIVFLEGFDPGVQFFSYYNRASKRSLTICLNDESMNCDEVFARYYSMIG
ncbi:MAG: beta-lactamase family protein [Lachnospiraceae bacterium]|nr:beta-lactamase family protein [Lachnospiraceae bacterium]